MNKRMMVAAAAIAAAFAIAGCGQTKGDGGLNMDVGVSNLLETQNFCYTWRLYQEVIGTDDWELIDEITTEICAPPGVDDLDAYATCYDGRRFMIVYNVTYYDESGAVLGTATGTSGGGEDDVCVKNTDIDTSALFQFRNEGNAGGVNPEVLIDQVCTNDKAVFEDDGATAVSAVWVQPDQCLTTNEGTPDSYCALGFGSGLVTQRYGITVDGLTRFVFSDSPWDAQWDVYYLFFEPTVPMDALILEHSPYVLHHALAGGVISRGAVAAEVAFRYDSAASIAIGFAELIGTDLEITYDLNGKCNGAVDPLAASSQMLPVAGCVAPAVLLGANPSGGSAFQLVVQCADGFHLIDCDAAGVAGGICQ